MIGIKRPPTGLGWGFDICIAVLALWTSVAVAEGTHPAAPQSPSSQVPQPSEAQRLTQLRELVRSERLPRLSPLSGNPELCQGLLDDLLHEREFRPIEPVAVITRNYPRFRERSPAQDNGLDALSTGVQAKLRRCAAQEAHGDERRARVLFNGLDSFAGLPPYRIYDGIRITSDASKRPEIVYWSEYDAGTGFGREGYSAVDLTRCEHTHRLPVQTSSRELRLDRTSHAAALTTHDGNVAVWQGLRGVDFEVDVFRRAAQGAPSPELVCSWATFPISEPTLIPEVEHAKDTRVATQRIE
jgi:hypothetical protein